MNQGWDIVKLSEVTTIESGGTPNTKNDEYWIHGNVLWATLPDLQNKYIFDTNRKITEKGLKNSSAKLLPKNSVIFSSRATIGDIAIAKNELSTNQGSKNFICNSEKIDYEFLYYLLTAHKNNIKHIATGATYKEINKTVFSNYEINLPPLPTQRKIAGVLSAYDDLIENNTRRIAILEEMAQRIYKEWFVDFKYPGHENDTMVDSELGMIPEGWEVKKLGDLIEYKIGGGWGKEEKIDNYTTPAFVIRGTDIPSSRHGNIDNCPFRYHTESNLKSRILESGDIVFEVSGGSKGQPLGRTLLVNQKLLSSFSDPVICASFCKLIRPNKEKISSEFLYLNFLEIYDNLEITKYQVQSTGISNFKFSIFLEKHLVVKPENKLIIKFTNSVSGIFNQIQILGKQNQTLRQTRDLLLPKLISGKVDVSELGIWSELTASIHAST